jgi:hypothetical protein
MQHEIERFIRAVESWLAAAGNVARYALIEEKEKRTDRTIDPILSVLDDCRLELECTRRELLSVGEGLLKVLEAAKVDITGVLKIVDFAERRRGHKTVLEQWLEIKAALQNAGHQRKPIISTDTDKT